MFHLFKKVSTLPTDYDINAHDDQGNTKLFNSINNINIVKKLLKNGADPNIQNKNGSTVLEESIIWGIYDIAKLLLENGADPNLNNGLSMFYAMHKHNKFIELLLNYKANVNYKNKNGQTLLFIKGIYPEKALLLLNNDVNPNIIDNEGKSALFYHNNIEIIDLLLKNGADPNVQKSFEKETVLFDTIYYNNIEMTQLLLKYGADPNIQNEYGKTVLFDAVKQNKIEITKLLLEYGADPDIEYNNKTPRKIAKDKNFEEIIRLFN